MSLVRGIPSAKATRYESMIRAIALAYPETHEDHPWEHSAFKVKGKVFVFLALEESGLSLSVKLKQSLAGVLDLPFTEPTGYGLGKHGWVSAEFGPDEDLPIDLIKKWIDESFRLIAPKKVLSQLKNPAPAQPKPRPPSKMKKKAAPAKPRQKENA